MPGGARRCGRGRAGRAKPGPRGARRVVLMSRSGPAAAGAAELAAGLAGTGTAVAVLAGDAGQREQAAAVLAWTGPELSAVMHTAGIGQACPLAETPVSGLAGVMAAKAAGAAHLHELTAGL